MKKESRDQLLCAYDDAFRVLGFADYPAALRYIVHDMEAKLGMLKRARNRPGLEALLVREPEPPPAQLSAMVKAIRSLPYTFRKVLPEATKELPHKPGGRNRAIEVEEYPKICREIGLLIAGEKVSLRDAQKRIAQRYGVSLRTIQRIWQQRGGSK
jgi:hypothetical protein